MAKDTSAWPPYPTSSGVQLPWQTAPPPPPEINPDEARANQAAEEAFWGEGLDKSKRGSYYAKFPGEEAQYVRGRGLDQAMDLLLTGKEKEGMELLWALDMNPVHAAQSLASFARSYRIRPECLLRANEAYLAARNKQAERRTRPSMEKTAFVGLAADHAATAGRDIIHSALTNKDNPETVLAARLIVRYTLKDEIKEEYFKDAVEYAVPTSNKYSVLADMESEVDLCDADLATLAKEQDEMRRRTGNTKAKNPQASLIRSVVGEKKPEAAARKRRESGGRIAFTAEERARNRANAVRRITETIASMSQLQLAQYYLSRRWGRNIRALFVAAAPWLNDINEARRIGPEAWVASCDFAGPTPKTVCFTGLTNWIPKMSALGAVHPFDGWVRDLTGDGDIEANPGPVVTNNMSDVEARLTTADFQASWGASMSVVRRGALIARAGARARCPPGSGIDYDLAERYDVEYPDALNLEAPLPMAETQWYPNTFAATPGTGQGGWAPAARQQLPVPLWVTRDAAGVARFDGPDGVPVNFSRVAQTGILATLPAQNIVQAAVPAAAGAAAVPAVYTPDENFTTYDVNMYGLATAAVPQKWAVRAQATASHRRRTGAPIFNVTLHQGMGPTIEPTPLTHDLRASAPHGPYSNRPDAMINGYMKTDLQMFASVERSFGLATNTITVKAVLHYLERSMIERPDSVPVSGLIQTLEPWVSPQVGGVVTFGRNICPRAAERCGGVRDPQIPFCRGNRGSIRFHTSMATVINTNNVIIFPPALALYPRGGALAFAALIYLLAPYPLYHTSAYIPVRDTVTAPPVVAPAAPVYHEQVYSWLGQFIHIDGIQEFDILLPRTTPGHTPTVATANAAVVFRPAFGPTPTPSSRPGQLIDVTADTRGVPAPPAIDLGHFVFSWAAELRAVDFASVLATLNTTYTIGCPSVDWALEWVTMAMIRTGSLTTGAPREAMATISQAERDAGLDVNTEPALNTWSWFGQHVPRLAADDDWRYVRFPRADAHLPAVDPMSFSLCAAEMSRMVGRVYSQPAQGIEFFTIPRPLGGMLHAYRMMSCAATVHHQSQGYPVSVWAAFAAGTLTAAGVQRILLGHFPVEPFAVRPMLDAYVGLLGRIFDCCLTFDAGRAAPTDSWLSPRSWLPTVVAFDYADTYADILPVTYIDAYVQRSANDIPRGMSPFAFSFGGTGSKPIERAKLVDPGYDRVQPLLQPANIHATLAPHDIPLMSDAEVWSMRLMMTNSAHVFELATYLGVGANVLFPASEVPVKRAWVEDACTLGPGTLCNDTYASTLWLPFVLPNRSRVALSVPQGAAAASVARLYSGQVPGRWTAWKFLGWGSGAPDVAQADGFSANVDAMLSRSGKPRAPGTLLPGEPEPGLQTANGSAGASGGSVVREGVDPAGPLPVPTAH